MTELIANHVWQSTVFAAGIALLTLAFRRNRAHVRYWLWLAASVKFLIPFAALLWIGTQIELVPIERSGQAIVSILDNAAQPFTQPEPERVNLRGRPVPPPPPNPMLTLAIRGFTVVWPVGSVALLLVWAVRWHRVTRAARASSAITGGPLLDTLRHLEGDAPRGRGAPRVRLVSSNQAIEPGVFGILRPVLMWPAGIEDRLSDEQIAAILAHEVAHVRRRDNLAALIHMLVEAVFWFHPLVWWIGARLVATREEACDEHVVSETAAPIPYAEGIVNVCRRYVETPLMSVTGVGGADVRARIDAILSNRIGLRLTLPKRLVLATAAVAAFVVPLAAGAINRATLAAEQAQGATPGRPFVDPEARFEVVSIKRFDTSGATAPRISMTPGRYDVAGIPLSLVVGQALGTPADRIFGLPDWVNTELYAIAAKAPDDPPPAAIAMNVMLANLLKDRFNLATHRETRQLPVYDLVFARTDKRLGTGLKPASPECQAALSAQLEAVQRGAAVAPPLGPTGCTSARLNPGMVGFNGVPMSMIAQHLTQSVGRPVIDKTGLTGYYDYMLKWAPQPGSVMPFQPAGGPPAAPPPAADPDGPNLFTAVQEQLGLKLESTRGPVEVIVIDRLDKPKLD